MKILITGTASGIGKAAALKFLENGHKVIGFDIIETGINNPNYTHHICDVSKPDMLPDITDLEVVVNNAATASERNAIATNLEGYINIAEKYAFQEKIKCLINIGSISGRDGLDRPRYSASQGGRIAYTKNLAIRLGKLYKARAICLSFGAVLTGLEPNLYKDPALVQAVANENILKKWITCEEAADWIYFLACVDKCCTAQDILVDNGEEGNFNWIESEPKE